MNLKSNDNRPVSFKDQPGFMPSRECVKSALDSVQTHGRLNCIQTAHLAAGAQRYLDITEPATEPYQFCKERMAASPDYPKVDEIIMLLIEARDALPAITMAAAKLRGIDLTLADRIEACLQPWETTADDPEGI